MKILDFRIRPPLLGFLKMAMFDKGERRDRFTRQIGFSPSPSAQQHSMPMLLDDIKAAGVVRAVMSARVSDVLGTVSNEDVLTICKQYPDLFIGVAAVNPTTRRQAVKEIDGAIEAGFSAIAMEPGAYPVPLYADDRKLYPIYGHLEDRGVPMLLTTGGNAGPDLSYTLPVQVDRIAGDFPSLKIVLVHGNWPWVHEILHVAFRRPNVYVSPDMYLPMHGMDDYVKAADTWLADRFIYGSSYPFASVKDYAAWFMKLPIRPESMERILYRNAADLLGLE